jgi:hypothetical protein
MWTIQTLRRCLHKLRLPESGEICTKLRELRELRKLRNWDMYKTKTQLRETERARVGFPFNLYYLPRVVSKLRDGSLNSNWWLWFAPTRCHASNMRSVTCIWQRPQVLLLTPCVKIAYSRVIARVHCPLDLCYSSILFFRCPFQIRTQSSRQRISVMYESTYTLLPQVLCRQFSGPWVQGTCFPLSLILTLG